MDYRRLAEEIVREQREEENRRSRHFLYSIAFVALAIRTRNRIRENPGKFVLALIITSIGVVAGFGFFSGGHIFDGLVILIITLGIGTGVFNFTDRPVLTILSLAGYGGLLLGLIGIRSTYRSYKQQSQSHPSAVSSMPIPIPSQAPNTTSSVSSTTEGPSDVPSVACETSGALASCQPNATDASQADDNHSSVDANQLVDSSGATPASTTSSPVVNPSSPTNADTAERPPGREVLAPSAAIVGMKIAGEEPQYPAVAKAARVQGTVVLEAVISTSGTVENLNVLSGPPLLQEAALEAVKTWRYKPYLVNGEPTRINTHINVLFHLQ